MAKLSEHAKARIRERFHKFDENAMATIGARLGDKRAYTVINDPLVEGEARKIEYMGKDVCGIVKDETIVTILPERCQTLNAERASMSVKDVCEAMGVPRQTVLDAINRLFPGKTRKGVATRLNEAEAFEVSKELKRSHNNLTGTREVAVTSLEMMEKVADGWKALMSLYEEEKSKRIAAEARNERLIHNSRTFTSQEIAKELGIRSAQELNARLHEMGIQFKDKRGVWMLYAEYASNGYTEIKQEEINGAPRYHRKWTGSGRDWLLGLFSARV